MLRSIFNKTWAVTSVMLGGLLFAAFDTQAMPSFARQTGMNCNSCHIGTDNVPNFTRTGRIFAMRGYTRPVVRERLRSDGDTIEDELQYGGHYLSLNWNDFFSARLISEIVQGGSSAAGVKSDLISRPLGRMAFFYTGPITDWLGLWTEIGYLGNNSLLSVSSNGGTLPGPTGLNFYAYDEYRLSTGVDIGPGTFIGLSYGNELPNVVSQWVFPAGMPDMWSNGQGGTGRFKEIAQIGLHGLWNDRVYWQGAIVTGDANNKWNDGYNKYGALFYNIFNTTRNDLWAGVEMYTGNDATSQMISVKSSFICAATCPTGVTDSTMSITNQVGGGGVILGAPTEKIKDFNSYKLRVEHSVADRGPHSWIASAVYAYKQENYVSGGKVERGIIGIYGRYFYDRTYGVLFNWNRDTEYTYTNAAGLKRAAYAKSAPTVTLLWNPAMNFSVHLNYNPLVQNKVFADQKDRYLGKGSTYGLGMEYNF